MAGIPRLLPPDPTTPPVRDPLIIRISGIGREIVAHDASSGLRSDYLKKHSPRPSGGFLPADLAGMFGVWMNCIRKTPSPAICFPVSPHHGINPFQKTCSNRDQQAFCSLCDPSLTPVDALNVSQWLPVFADYEIIMKIRLTFI